MHKSIARKSHVKNVIKKEKWLVLCVSIPHGSFVLSVWSLGMNKSIACCYNEGKIETKLMIELLLF